jgi:hypothetical protein
MKRDVRHCSMNSACRSSVIQSTALAATAVTRWTLWILRTTRIEIAQQQGGLSIIDITVLIQVAGAAGLAAELRLQCGHVEHIQRAVDDHIGRTGRRDAQVDAVHIPGQ